MGALKLGLFQHLDLEASGACPTAAMLDNVLSVACALYTGQPLLIIGDPGLGKTMAINMILERMKRIAIHEDKGQLQLFAFQCSSTTTVKQINQLGETAERFRSLKLEALPCVELEEVSLLPTMSARALHRFLDREVCVGQKTHGIIIFLATANYPPDRGGTAKTSGSGHLDPALLSRFLILRHERTQRPDLVQLCDQVLREAEGAQPELRARKGELQMHMDTLIGVLRAHHQGAQQHGEARQDQASLRDVLYYLRSLIHQLGREDPPAELKQAASLAFACHLGLFKTRATGELWAAVSTQVLGAPEPPTLPGVVDIFKHLLQCEPNRPDTLVRHVMIKFSVVRDILDVISKLQRVSRSGGRDIFPIYSSPWEQGDSITTQTHLNYIKVLMELGDAIILVINPLPVLQALHTVLNVAYTSNSTNGEVGVSSIHTGISHETVAIKRGVRFVFLVSADDTRLLEESTVSRLSVIDWAAHRSFPTNTSARSIYEDLAGPPVTREQREELLDQLYRSGECVLMEKLAPGQYEQVIIVSKSPPSRSLPQERLQHVWVRARFPADSKALRQREQTMLSQHRPRRHGRRKGGQAAQSCRVRWGIRGTAGPPCPGGHLHAQ
jgi:hypothetical protein